MVTEIEGNRLRMLDKHSVLAEICASEPEHERGARVASRAPVHRQRSTDRDARRLAALRRSGCPPGGGLDEKARPRLPHLAALGSLGSWAARKLRYRWSLLPHRSPWTVALGLQRVTSRSRFRRPTIPFVIAVTQGAERRCRAVGGGGSAPGARALRWGEVFAARRTGCCWQIASAPPPALDPCQGCKHRGCALDALAPLL